MTFRLIKDIRDILGPSRSLCDCVNKFKDFHTGPIQGNQRWSRRAASSVFANGFRIAVSPACVQPRGKSGKWLHHCSFWDGIPLVRSESKRSGVRVGVDIFRPQSESESLKIRRLRSPCQRNTAVAAALISALTKENAPLRRARNKRKDSEM